MRRKLFAELKNHLSKKEFCVLTGARQTGKSTLLKQIEEDCREKGLPCTFINLERKNILADLNADPLNILKYLPETSERKIVLIDEIQYLDDPSNFLKLLYDDHVQDLKLLVTGSSAFYIDDQFRDSLAGRKKLFQLLTCSFNEYLELSNKPDLLAEKKRIENSPNAKTTELAYLKNEWEQYMIFGGYPAVILEETKTGKIEKLKEIRDSFIKRDILESGVVNEAEFYQLFRLLAAQVGQLVNASELSITLRIKHTTVNNYLWVMQKCFHVALIKPFYRNIRKELTKMPKAFLMDTGLRNALVNNFEPLSSRSDKGELWENMFFRLLAEKMGWDEINYWRTADGNEVDFVLPDLDGGTKAFEVKYDRKLVKPLKYKKFTEAYPNIPLQFASLEPFDESFFRNIHF